ncbi:hypothetical protein Hroenn_gp38 [Pelagibacter phage Hroenn EXVC015P]|nr:hypothetical protein Bylgja_gp28 [Pelagibacter phage Bylgja EXVC010P]QLF88322.1 hypothetical protein Himinglaeva_gp28 [Pelagibacter phage Himinglaeva EXVC011P]QLF88383.1 hypothetical protein Hroenn_gp38 [Pelagibacter phage Hroenn EXVC015P]QLF88570.1 hypothetical protein Unn_gp12 [Pelagibacter phage Unn EXVC019P]
MVIVMSTLNLIMCAVMFALSFALMFLGVIIFIHFQTWIGLAIAIVGGLIFFKDLHYG